MRTETVTTVRGSIARFIREVNYTKVPIVITEHGAPVALLAPLPPELMTSPTDTEGST